MKNLIPGTIPGKVPICPIIMLYCDMPEDNSKVQQIIVR